MNNCWDCGMQQTGYCTWFRNRKKIPMNIVDKGCSHYRHRTVQDIKTDNIISKIIDTFDGEVMNLKPEKKAYIWKKNYKSKHKYGVRKDW